MRYEIRNTKYEIRNTKLKCGAHVKRDKFAQVRLRRCEACGLCGNMRDDENTRYEIRNTKYEIRNTKGCGAHVKPRKTWQAVTSSRMWDFVHVRLRLCVNMRDDENTRYEI